MPFLPNGRRQIFLVELENKLAYYIIVYENKDSGQKPDRKSAGKETKPGLVDRIRRIFLTPVRVPDEDPPGRNSYSRDMPGCGLWLMKPMLPALPRTRSTVTRALGEVLLINLIELAMTKHARIVTLEARVSNLVAQNLYYKFSFDKLACVKHITWIIKKMRSSCPRSISVRRPLRKNSQR